jgi:hypothetical protein
MASRIYTVTTNDGPRLVKASTRQQALSHVAHAMFDIRVSNQDDLVTLIGKGVKVENFRDPDQQELEGI